ncbi:MAG: hypothetical protein AAF570_16140 [Bacteroidota bacterium]
MVRFIFAALLLVSAPAINASLVNTVSIEVSQNNIDQKTLGQLFHIAAVKWQTSEEDLWDQYENEDLMVEEVEPNLFFLDSVVFGGIEILLEEN